MEVRFCNYYPQIVVERSKIQVHMAWDLRRFIFWWIGSLTCKGRKEGKELKSGLRLQTCPNYPKTSFRFWRKYNVTVRNKEVIVYRAWFPGSLVLGGLAADNCISFVILICNSISICSAVLFACRKTLSWSNWLYKLQHQIYANIQK